MKFDFPVKHNGVIYPAGKIVPIGKEPKKENEVNDKSASEIRKELKEKYHVTKFPSNKKEDLAKMLMEEEAKAKESEVEEEEDEVEEGSNDLEPEKDGEVESNEDSTLLDKIVNEE